MPSKYKDDFAGFITLVLDKHGHMINTGCSREKHIKNTYLNTEDPCRLGGRAVGLPGQSGSNNNGERKNRSIKIQLKEQTRNLKAEEKNNPIYVLVACACDLKASPDIQKYFQVIPTRTIPHYHMLRDIMKASKTYGSLIVDLQYSVLTTVSHDKFLNNGDVIGNPEVSFTVHMPTGSQVYTSVKEEELVLQCTPAVTSFNEQRSNRHGSSGGAITTPEEASLALRTYDRSKQQQLYHRLALDCLTNTPGPKLNETLWDYVHRRCQRNAGTKAKQKNKNKGPCSKTERSKQANIDSEKYGSLMLDAGIKDGAEMEENEGGEKEVDDMDDFESCNDESTVDDIQQLLESLGFNFDDDAVISSQNDRNDRITIPRELGSWIEVEIDGTNKRVTCNCEDYNFHYLCVHQVTFDVLQFNRLPKRACMLHHENWHEMRKECIKYLKEATFWT